MLRTEVVEADIPLLIGNTTLIRGSGIIDTPNMELVLLGKRLKLSETESGYFSLKVKIPEFKEEKMVTIEDTLCLAIKAMTEISEKDVKKLHHYWGHCNVKKLAKVISQSGLMTEEIQGYLRKVKTVCESCKVNNNRKPRPAVALPRATRHNEVVSMDLKEYKNDPYNYIWYAVDLFSRFTVGGFIMNKKAETVAEKVLTQWVCLWCHGRPAQR